MGDDVRQLAEFPYSGRIRDANRADEYFEHVLREGFEERLEAEWLPQQEAGMLKHSLEEYEERLKIEIATINRMGFPGYFLIVWDFIKYAREQNIPVGPGVVRRRVRWRRIVCGSRMSIRCSTNCCSSGFSIPNASRCLISISISAFADAAMLSITLRELYGRNRFVRSSRLERWLRGRRSRMSAVRSNVPYGDVEKIAKMIPPPIRGRNVSISQAIETGSRAEGRDGQRPEVKELVDLALKTRRLFSAYFGSRGGRCYQPETAARTRPCRDVGQRRTYEPVSDERSRKGRDAQDGFSRADDADGYRDCLTSMKETHRHHYRLDQNSDQRSEDDGAFLATAARTRYSSLNPPACRTSAAR